MASKRPRLKKSERAGPLKTKSGITKAAVNIMTMSGAEKSTARKKRAARTAAVKGGAKKMVPAASGKGTNRRGKLTPAAKKLIKSGAKAGKPKPKKSMVGRDAKPPKRTWKARKRTT